MQNSKSERFRRGRHSYKPYGVDAYPDLKEAMLREMSGCSSCKHAEILAKYAALARQRARKYA